MRNAALCVAVSSHIFKRSWKSIMYRIFLSFKALHDLGPPFHNLSCLNVLGTQFITCLLWNLWSPTSSLRWPFPLVFHSNYCLYNWALNDFLSSLHIFWFILCLQARLWTPWSQEIKSEFSFSSFFPSTISYIE